MGNKKLTKRQRKQVAKFALSNWRGILAILFIFVIVAVLAYYMGWLDFLFKKEDTSRYTAGGYETEVDEWGKLQINFLDVGQADCSIIELPDGKNMIIDSGNVNADQITIADFMEENNIEYFDYLLLTHSDKDHVANMDWVLETYDVRYMFLPSIRATNERCEDLDENFNPDLIAGGEAESTIVYADFMNAAYNEKCSYEFFNKNSDFSNKILKGEEEMIYSFDFLTPTAKLGEIAYDDVNNYSPIMILEYAERKIMFNGDAMLDVLDEYLNSYGNANNVDVLKVGHHGAENGVTSEFLNAIDPEFAVIQCGKGNQHKHPRQEALDALSGYDENMALYRTDCNGTITLTIEYDGSMSWDFEKEDMSKNWLNGVDYADIVAYNSNLNYDISRYIEYCEILPSKKIA